MPLWRKNDDRFSEVQGLLSSVFTFAIFCKDYENVFCMYEVWVFLSISEFQLQTYHTLKLRGLDSLTPWNFEV